MLQVRRKPEPERRSAGVSARTVKRSPVKISLKIRCVAISVHCCSSTAESGASAAAWVGRRAVPPGGQQQRWASSHCRDPASQVSHNCSAAAETVPASRADAIARRRDPGKRMAALPRVCRSAIIGSPRPLSGAGSIYSQPAFPLYTICKMSGSKIPTSRAPSPLNKPLSLQDSADLFKFRCDITLRELDLPQAMDVGELFAALLQVNYRPIESKLSLEKPGRVRRFHARAPCRQFVHLRLS